MLAGAPCPSGPWDQVTQRTLAIAASCALAVLAYAAGSWQRSGVSWSCGSDLQAPHLLGAVQFDTATYLEEAPDNATLAICALMKLETDDPQWRDGRAEDLHEVRMHMCACGSRPDASDCSASAQPQTRLPSLRQAKTIQRDSSCVLRDAPVLEAPCDHCLSRCPPRRSAEY